MAGTGDDTRGITEWQEARNVIARFDNNLHDLRKYGFSFVTGLLAVSGLLGYSSSVMLPDYDKAAVLIVTLGLIVTLRFLDTNYRLFQTAASIRARIIENRLNLDLTGDIVTLYDLQSWWRYVQYLYYSFVVLTFALGTAILWPDIKLIAVLLLASIVCIDIIWGNNRGKLTALGDWSVDKKVLAKGDIVRITYTNLDERDNDVGGIFRLSWDLVRHGTSEIVKKEDFVKATLGYFDDYDWTWDSGGAEVGLYQLTMTATRLVASKSVSSGDPGSAPPPRGKREPTLVQSTTIQVLPKQSDETIKVNLTKRSK